MSIVSLGYNLAFLSSLVHGQDYFSVPQSGQDILATKNLNTMVYYMYKAQINSAGTPIPSYSIP